MTYLLSLLHWCAAHPVETLIYAWLLGSVVNGLLSARQRRSRTGHALHTALDRIAALTRRDAAGTLKWPLIAQSLLAPAPAEPERPTMAPPPAPPAGPS